MARAGASGWSAGWVIAGSIALVLVSGTIMWLAIPQLSANYTFVSPSGRVTIEIGEFCEDKCHRSIVAETEANGGRGRRGCVVDLPEAHPVLLKAAPLWAADERSVEIVHAGADGHDGRFTLDIARDCTLTD